MKQHKWSFTLMLLSAIFLAPLLSMAAGETRPGSGSTNTGTKTSPPGKRRFSHRPPPIHTAPSWSESYPFVEMQSTFVPYVHYVDFLKGGYVITE